MALREERERLKYEINGHLKAWDIEHADNERLRTEIEQLKSRLLAAEFDPDRFDPLKVGE